MSEPRFVYLYESNAGDLFIGLADGPWAIVTDCQHNKPSDGYPSLFHEDAEALLAGETSDWSVEWTDEHPTCEMVAVYSKEIGRVGVVVHGSCSLAYFTLKDQDLDIGRAAENYLGLNL